MFSGKIYTTNKNSTRLSVAAVATNFNSVDLYPQIILNNCWFFFQMNNYSLTEVGSDIIYWISGFKTSHTMKVMINDAAILTRRNSGWRGFWKEKNWTMRGCYSCFPLGCVVLMRFTRIEWFVLPNFLFTIDLKARANFLFKAGRHPCPNWSLFFIIIIGLVKNF